MNGAGFAEGEGGGVFAMVEGAAGGFDAEDFAFFIFEEGGEHADGVAASADTGDDIVGQLTGHFLELFAGFNPDDALKIAHHHGEGVGANHGANAVDGVDGVLEVGLESGVDSFLEGFQAVGNGHDLRPEDFHPGDIGVLLGDVDFAHVDLTFESEVGGGGGEGDPMLTSTGFGNEPFFAEVFGEKGFAHAVVELVGAGVVEVFALEVDPPSVAGTEVAAEVDRGGAALVMFADATQLRNEVMGLADGVIGLGDFIHLRLQFRGNETAAVFFEEAFGIRVFFEVVFHRFRGLGKSPFGHGWERGGGAVPVAVFITKPFLVKIKNKEC